MCADWVPHEGQEAVGDVVRKVRVISKATSTPSTWTSGRSRKMIIGFGWSLEKNSECEKMFNFPVYHISFQQGCVRSRLCVLLKWRQKLTIKVRRRFKRGSGHYMEHQFGQVLLRGTRSLARSCTRCGLVR